MPGLRRYQHEGVARLLTLMEDGDELVRAAIVTEIGRRGKGAVTAVVRLVTACECDPSRVVRGAATTALGALTHQGVPGIVHVHKLRAVLRAAYGERAERLAWTAARDARGDGGADPATAKRPSGARRRLAASMARRP